MLKYFRVLKIVIILETFYQLLGNLLLNSFKAPP